MAEVDAATRELASLREQQRALVDVLRAVTRSGGVEPVLEEIVSACTRLCDADHGALWLLHDDGLLHARVHRAVGYAARFDREHPHAVDRGTVAGRTAVTRAPVNIPDIREDTGYTYDGPNPYRAMLGVPILADEELIGVVVVVRQEPDPFTDEQAALAQAFADQAAIALTNARLIEAVERQRTELARFLSPQVADLISSPEGEALLAGHRAQITCLFFDLRGFTAFAETAAPEELLDLLRAYHAMLGELIRAHGGTLEHFAGDGTMVFFNDPVPLADHEVAAVRLALEARDGFERIAAEWQKRGVDLALGVGVEAGYATLGRIGFEGRHDYGALGPVTNLAARLSSAAAGRQILVGPRVFAAVDDVIETAPVGPLALKGFTRPVPVHEVVAIRDA